MLCVPIITASFAFAIYFYYGSIITKRNSVVTKAKLLWFETNWNDDHSIADNFNDKNRVPVFGFNYNGKNGYTISGSVYHKVLSEKDVGKEFNVRFKYSPRTKNIFCLCLDDEKMIKAHNRFHIIMIVIFTIIFLPILIFGIYFYTIL